MSTDLDSIALTEKEGLYKAVFVEEMSDLILLIKNSR
jgi:hypothetical protein